MFNEIIFYLKKNKSRITLYHKTMLNNDQYTRSNSKKTKNVFLK